MTRGSAALVVGVGFRSGVSADDLREALRQALDRAGLNGRPVTVVATLDSKLPDLAIRGLATCLGAELVGFPAEVLSEQPVPNPSARTAGAVATPSVAEASVLAAGVPIRQAKLVVGQVTVSIGTRS